MVTSGSTKLTGVGKYVQGLWDNLRDASTPGVSFVSSGSQELNPGSSSVLKLRKFPFLPWQQTSLPAYLSSHSYRVFHGPAFSLPRWGCFKKVVTIHDLGFSRYPQHVDDRVRTYLKAIVPMAIAQADAIIVPSSLIAKEIIEDFGEANKNKIFVIPLANSFAKTRQIGNSDKSIILHVGTLEPRKNLGVLLKAFDYGVETGIFPYKLVLVGGRGWKAEELDLIIENMRHRDRVVTTGYVDDQELEKIYNSAKLYVQPSLYEGFGIPSFDAYVRGIPIVAVKSGWLCDWEIDSQISMIGDPNDPAELADKMAIQLQWAGLTDRKAPMARGWKDVAMDHYALYQKVGG